MTLKINSPARKTTQTSPTPGKEETATQEEAKGHLPFEARRLAGLATAGNQLSTEEGILAWTSFDPYYDNNRKALRRLVFRRMGGYCLLLYPPFWPYAILFSPIIVYAMKRSMRTMQGQYWMLTKRDLRIVNTECDRLCKTIPLEQITSIKVVHGADECCYKVGAEYKHSSVIYVETLESIAYTRGAQESNTEKNYVQPMYAGHGVALENSDDFVKQVLEQQTKVKNALKEAMSKI
uniref:Uncharacterized protein n=1 Tax=Ditylum brightwellii TaxID=49249 RepID=A0A7S4VVY1_9STRA|mmetsp:Transcript_21538/g.31856  ORF Transcript_21538/g.31856 Transcript_21538/m.31856 type:complete len:236 (+) Transcript_21538:160-867(+)